MTERDHAERAYAESLTPGAIRDAARAHEQILICEGCGQRLPFDISIEHYCPSKPLHVRGAEGATTEDFRGDSFTGAERQTEAHQAERSTYVPLDAFRLDDGRVMVRPDTVGHRIPEEYAPVAEIVALLRSYANVHMTKALADLIEHKYVQGGPTGRPRP